MRVLLAGDSTGGAFRFMSTLAAGLRGQGVVVGIAAAGREAPVTDGTSAPVEWREAREEWAPDPWRDVDDSGRWLLARARRFRPDVVHVNSYAAAALPFATPTVLTAHSDVATWWRAVHGCAAPRAYDEYGRRVRAGLLAAGAVVAPTRAYLRALIAEHGPVPTARVIPNGAEEGPSAARKSPLVLTAGRFWDTGKNLGVLAGARLPPPWSLEAAGAAGHPDAAAAQPAGVRCCGPLRPADLRARMAEAAVYVQPSLYEPFGLGILEAALAGCALLLADLPELRESWAGAALFAAPRNRAGFGRALRRLAAEPGLRRRAGRLARRRSRRFPVDRMTAAYLDLYRALLDGTGVRCAS